MPRMIKHAMKFWWKDCRTSKVNVSPKLAVSGGNRFIEYRTALCRADSTIEITTLNNRWRALRRAQLPRSMGNRRLSEKITGVARAHIYTPVSHCVKKRHQ